MNDRERFASCLNGNNSDRLFRTEPGPWPTTFERWKKEGFPVNMTFHEYFNFDRLYHIQVFSGYTESPFYPLFDKVILEESVDTTIIRDQDGVTKKILKEHSDTSMPQFLKYVVQNRRDWKEVEKRLDPSNVIRLLGNLDAITLDIHENQREFPAQLTACGAFGHLRNLLGNENLAYMLYDDSDLVKEILANWLQLYKEILRQVAGKIGIDCFLIWEDMCYKNGPLISPFHFQKFIVPVYKELISFAKGVGVKSVWVDTDGDLSKLIPLFVECGVDALMPFEVQAGMDIVKIRKDFGSSFAIVGGIDKRALAKDYEAIKKEVDRVIPFFLDSGKFIPTLDHTVPPDVSLDNFKYYLERVRSYE